MLNTHPAQTPDLKSQTDSTLKVAGDGGRRTVGDRVQQRRDGGGVSGQMCYISCRYRCSRLHSLYASTNTFVCPLFLYLYIY